MEAHRDRVIYYGFKSITSGFQCNSSFDKGLALVKANHVLNVKEVICNNCSLIYGKVVRQASVSLPAYTVTLEPSSMSESPTNSPSPSRDSSSSPVRKRVHQKSSSPEQKTKRKRNSSPDESDLKRSSHRSSTHKSRNRPQGSKEGKKSHSPRRKKSESPKSRSESYSSSSSRSRSRSTGRETEGARLHVADLGMGITKHDLKHVYEKFGPLREVWVAKSPPCFAFIVFRMRDDAEDALKSTDGMTLCGSRVRVSFARPRTRGRGTRGFDPNMRCYQCGDKGHFSRDCPDTRYGYKRPPSRSPSHRKNGQSSNRRQGQGRTRRRY